MARLSKKDIKLQAKAIMESNSLQEAYSKTHNCTEETAEKNAYKMLKNPEILAELEKRIESTKPINVNKTTLTQILTLVVHNWQKGKEKTADLLRAVEILSKLCPEFSEKKDINVYQNMTEDQINKEINDKLRSLDKG